MLGTHGVRSLTVLSGKPLPVRLWVAEEIAFDLPDIFALGNAVADLTAGLETDQLHNVSSFMCEELCLGIVAAATIVQGMAAAKAILWTCSTP